jgi:FAD/FMN-containing dehydrogenase
MYSDLAHNGVSVPAGSCPTVGIAGLALGGGIGVMDRLHGLTCDHIVGLEIVTAAGEVVRAGPGINPDLYWACRGGGGGNFGIVTEFQFSTFPITEVSLFSATWAWQAAAEVLPGWLEWVTSSPDPLWSNCLLQTSPGAGARTVLVGGLWAGSLADAGAQLRTLIEAVGGPQSQVAGANGFEDAMFIEAGCSGLSQAACHVAGQYPGGAVPRVLRLLKSDILNAPLSDKGVRAVLDGIDRRHQEGGPGEVIFDSWGGAINRVAPEATAFVHRKAIASAQYDAAFPPGVSAAALQAAGNWIDSWYASLRPYMGGEAYQNYIDAGLSDWEHAYYGANLARLEQVKAKWDPDDVFHFAQSIPLP